MKISISTLVNISKNHFLLLVQLVMMEETRVPTIESSSSSSEEDEYFSAEEEQPVETVTGHEPSSSPEGEVALALNQGVESSQILAPALTEDNRPLPEGNNDDDSSSSEWSSDYREAYLENERQYRQEEEARRARRVHFSEGTKDNDGGSRPKRLRLGDRVEEWIQHKKQQPKSVEKSECVKCSRIKERHYKKD